MADNPASHQFDLVPEEAGRQLVLPAEMISKGLELAIRIEKRQGLIKYDTPILKFPGLLQKSCINFSRDGKFAAITSYGKQADNPGLVIWNIASRVLSIFPEAGFKYAAPAHFFVERIPTDEQLGVTQESRPISDIRISVTNTLYKPIGDPASTPWPIYSVALSRNGEMALIGYDDGSIYRCNIIDGQICQFNIVARELYIAHDEV